MFNSRRFLMFACTTTSSLLLRQPPFVYADNNKAAKGPLSFGTQQHNAPSNSTLLHTYIPTPHQTRTVVQQTLVDWVAKSTRDYQLLEFAPKNLPMQIAFLRLIGVQQVSLKQFSREKGSTECFLNELANIHILKDAIPLLTRDTEAVFKTISEFNTEKPSIFSFDPNIHNPIDHVRPALFDLSETAFHKSEIESLYRVISQSTDDELWEFCNVFLVNEGPQNKKILFENLQKARIVCATHVRNSIPAPSYPGI